MKRQRRGCVGRIHRSVTDGGQYRRASIPSMPSMLSLCAHCGEGTAWWSIFVVHALCVASFVIARWLNIVWPSITLVPSHLPLPLCPRSEIAFLRWSATAKPLSLCCGME